MTSGTVEGAIAAAKDLSPDRLREMLVFHYPMEHRAFMKRVYEKTDDDLLLGIFGAHVAAWSLGILMGVQSTKPAQPGVS